MGLSGGRAGQHWPSYHWVSEQGGVEGGQASTGHHTTG